MKSKLIGKKYTNKQGQVGIIIDAITPSDSRSSVKYTTMVKIKFNSGYIGEYDIRNVRKGIFKDYGLPNKAGGYNYPRKTEQNIKIYNMWNHMMNRCYNPKTWNYDSYGGRGVTVDERWKHFENFEEDIKNLEGYERMIDNPDDYSLDKDSKIEGNKVYSKDTCVLINKKEQSLNRRNVLPIACTDNEGNVTIFNSKTEASIALGVDRSNILKVIKGEISQTKGYTFTHITE